ncbi:Dihydroorotate dehydrogenase B (NAD(+)) electron transfer subunit, partial [termite gut metagenome]
MFTLFSHLPIEIEFYKLFLYLCLPNTIYKHVIENLHMKKYILDLEVTENNKLNDNYVLLKLTSKSLLPEMIAGQFAEIRVDNSQATYLRRPISINYIDRQRYELWLLIQLVGNGTKSLARTKSGDTINAILPLGNGFSMPKSSS